MTTIPVLRTTSAADLLALPSFLFEFHPAESVVVIAMRGNTVCFSARLDVDWFTKYFDQAAEQVLCASAHIGAAEFFLLGYSEDPELASISVEEAGDVIGRSRVAEALITDGSHYWSLIDGTGPLPFDPAASSVAAQAVYQGVNVHASREEAVAPVLAWDGPPDATVLEETLARVDSLGAADEAMELMAELVESEAPLGTDDALLLACLLVDDDRAAAVLTRIDTGNAGGIRANLLAARRIAPAFVEPTVVALLGIACWLSGHGAQSTACIEQMAQLDPVHPIGMLLTQLHLKGVPPQRWDG